MKYNHNVYLLFTVLCCYMIVFTGCNNEDLIKPNANTNSAENLLEVSYTMTTTRDYDVSFEKASSIDLSVLNPSSEKQEITMALFESGQMDITIKALDFKEKIKNLHKILPDDSPQIVKTVISGSTIKFYDENDKLLNTETIPIPDHTELVKTIKDIGTEFSPEDVNSVVATMQGHHLIDNLEDFIKDLGYQNGTLSKSSKNNTDPITIVEQGDNFVTLRMPLSAAEPAMNQEAVLLIDKTLNKLVGTRIYNSGNTLLQSTFFGYNDGEVQSLNAIKTIEKVTLASGDEVDMITYSKIDDMELNLNL